MKKIMITISLLLLLFAPLLSAQNNGIQSTEKVAAHSMSLCDEGSCVSNAQRCCISNSIISFYLEQLVLPEGLFQSQEVVYIEYTQQTLLGSKSIHYRPPISLVIPMEFNR